MPLELYNMVYFQTIALLDRRLIVLPGIISHMVTLHVVGRKLILDRRGLAPIISFMIIARGSRARARTHTHLACFELYRRKAVAFIYYISRPMKPTTILINSAEGGGGVRRTARRVQSLKFSTPKHLRRALELLVQVQAFASKGDQCHARRN